jgi:hemoglobin
VTQGSDARAQIDALVRAFYRDVATDDLLGPIFDGMGVDWPSHVDKLSDFWAWQLLGEPGYRGNPLRAHEPVHACYGFRPEHYERWLTMFTELVDEHLSGSLAEAAKVRSAKMARALRRLLDGDDAPGQPPTEPSATLGPPAR